MSYPLVTNFTVGPAKLYHGVADFLCEQLQSGLGEVSHRSKDFSAMSEASMTAFREFFRIPTEYHVYYTYSATEGMEILTRSAVDEKICHVSNGNFGNVWTKTSQKAGKTVQKITHEDGTRVELGEIIPEAETEFLALTANETATGIAYSPDEIAQIRSSFPDLLLGIDVTSAMGAIAYDFLQADGWFFSVQKAFGLPAGLGILIVSPRLMQKTIARQEAGADVGCHHRLTDLEKKMSGKFQTPTTPNVMNIAALGFVSRQLQADFGSLPQLYNATQTKARMLYDFFDQHPTFRPAISSGRSESVIVVDGTEADLAALHERLAASGIEVGKGYGGKKTTQIRIGNFPVHSEEDVRFLLENI